MYDVFVTSNLEMVKTLKRMKLVMGRDYTTEKGAVSAGRKNQIILRFKDRNKALLFKLQAGIA